MDFLTKMTATPFGAEVLPVTRVEIELTEACNLYCRFCYHSRAPRDNQHASAILHRLAEAGVMEIILTGGEPALAPNFFETLDLACELFPRVMVQSNGTLFADPAVFARLAAHKIFCLNFSLHGPRKVHEEMTGVHGSFDAVCAALRAAVRANIRVASNLVLHRGNAAPQILEESVALLASLGCKEMTMTRFIPTGLGTGQPLGLSSAEFCEAVNNLRCACDEHGISFLLANGAPACQMPAELRDLCNRCSFGFDKFYIDVAGNVLVCGMSRQILGNLLEMPLNELLARSPLYNRYISLQHLPKKCRNCNDLDICGGGCRAAALAQTGSIDGADHL